jgi:hypothetical protein
MRRASTPTTPTAPNLVRQHPHLHPPPPQEEEEEGGRKETVLGS